MKIVFIDDCDFVNYSKPSMFIGFPYCTFKCNIEQCKDVCQNGNLKSQQVVDVSYRKLYERYMNNTFTIAFVFGGLEPFDSPELLEFITYLRTKTTNDIVIYTGYTKSEFEEGKVPFYEPDKELLAKLTKFKNIILKYGRYIDSLPSHYDKVLGVELASSNQFAERLVDES